MDEFVLDQKFIDLIAQDIKRNPFSPINKIISEQLYARIINGDILPEHRLVESKIAQSLSVSRSPVKQALQELEDRGMLVRGKGNTLCVRKVNYEDCYKVFEARIAIEPQAAYYAATRIRDEELERLRLLVEEFVEIDNTKDQKAYSKADKMFHEQIIASARNPYITEMYHCLEFTLSCYRHQLDQLIYEELHQRTGLPHGSGYHSHIYNMLRLHIPLSAQEGMRNDIQRMFGTLSRLTW